MLKFRLGGRKSRSAGLNPPVNKTIFPESVAFQGDVLDTYIVRASDPEDARADITICDVNRFGKLYVNYPEMTEDELHAYRILIENLYFALPDTLIDDPSKAIESYVWETAEKAGILGIVQRSAAKLSYHLAKDTFGFEGLEAVMRDDDIEEISATRCGVPVRVRHRRYTEFGFMETNISFESEEILQAYVLKLAQVFGETITRAIPYVESSRLINGTQTRLAATLGDEISLPGSSFCIRKQKERPITISQMANSERANLLPSRVPHPSTDLEHEPLRYEEVPYHKTITSLMAGYLWILLETTSNIIVCGETASGKTTMLNGILSLVNPTSKIVTCEDTPEIDLPPVLHWERLKTRTARGFTKGSEKFDVGLYDLLKRSLRFSPDYLIVGEVRGAEAQTLGQAMMAGHSCVATIHAGSTQQCISRLLTPPMSLAVGEVQQITCVICMRKVTLTTGKVTRRVESIDEVLPEKIEEGYRILNVFRYLPAKDEFIPTDPAAVVEQSMRLREKGASLGWSNEQMLQELEARAAYLSEIVNKEGFSIEEFTDKVRTYRRKLYEQPGELSKEVLK